MPLLAFGQTHSTLDPKGESAARIADMAYLLFIGGGAVFAVVLALAGLALFGPQPVRAALRGTRLILAGGIAFPVLVLSALLVHASLAAPAVLRRGETPALRIEVAGEMWWWRVRYLDESGRTIAEGANEIHIPAQRPVEFVLVSSNVIHSFWIPSLAGKVDMIPGAVNRLRLSAAAPGVFRGQCAEYCGVQHANMALMVVARPQAEFDAWLAAQARPAIAPAGPLQQQGMALFLANGCARCHAVRGTSAAGTLGPDLTHVGARLTLGAGVLPANAGTFAGWVADIQHIKPGSQMPAFHQFSGEQLRALGAYLEGLR